MLTQRQYALVWAGRVAVDCDSISDNWVCVLVPVPAQHAQRGRVRIYKGTWAPLLKTREPSISHQVQEASVGDINSKMPWPKDGSLHAHRCSSRLYMTCQDTGNANYRSPCLHSPEGGRVGLHGWAVRGSCPAMYTCALAHMGALELSDLQQRPVADGRLWSSVYEGLVRLQARGGRQKSVRTHAA